MDDDHYGGKCTDLPNCRFVMRGIAWFEDFVGSSDKNANYWIALNAQLCNGFALSTEPDFEGKQMISASKDNQAIYQKLHNLIGGKGKPADVTTALKGLPAARAAYYQGRYDANRSTQLQKSKASDEARKKKRKREAAPSSSTTDDPDEEEEEEE